MKRALMKGTGLLAAALLLATSAAAAARDVDRTVKADKDGLVTIENIAGSVRIEGWDKAEVRITGTLGKEVEDLEVKDSGRRTIIKVVYPKKIKSIDEGAELVVMVPRDSGLEVECVSAPVTVDGVEGELELSSVSGEVTVKGACRKLEAETISGALAVESGCPEIAVQSISGEVTVRAERAEIEAQTVSGRIEVHCGAIEGLSVESVSGKARVKGGLDKNAKVSIDLHSGDLDLAFEGKVNADFEVETFSGDIENAFGPEAKKTSRYVPGQTLEFTAGEGGARVRINTFSGDVVIRRD